MADLGLGIVGVVGTIEICFRAGKSLVQACRDYVETDVKLYELSVRIQVCWSRIAAQLEVTRQLESGMSDEQRESQSRVLCILQSKLEDAVVVISKPDKNANSKINKGIRFLNLRETLEKTVSDLESWQKRAEPSWFQVIKTASPLVDGVLRNVASFKPEDREGPTRDALRFRRAFDSTKSVFLAEQAVANLDRLEIPCCQAQIAIERNNSKYYVVETVSQEIVNRKDARELASRLRDSNPSIFGLLKCKGIMQLATEASPSLTFVFRMPDGYQKAQSLRQLLCCGLIPDSLTKRLEIARQLVTAAYYVHLYDFVHKNITPETILRLESDDGQSKPLVCLVGFQSFRYADGKTNTPRIDRRDSIYQHPSRIGHATVDFIMQHDIYSLGVCLMEIGLWQSLVDDGVEKSAQVLGDPTIGQAASQAAGIESSKASLITLSRGPLRAKMGDTYSKVVETCLTCLDQGNMEFGDPREFEDDDGVEVGSRYMKKVMDAIGTINY